MPKWSPLRFHRYRARLFSLLFAYTLALVAFAAALRALSLRGFSKTPFPAQKAPVSLLIIVLGYNRPLALRRLLESLAKVNWLQTRIDLRVWIDAGDIAASYDVAKGFHWDHGQKIVRQRLRHHGLCGSWLNAWPAWDTHEYALILEDDLEVHPQIFEVFQYLIAKGVRANASGFILEKLAEVPCGSLVHYASSWAPVFSRRLFQDFARWYDSRRKCAPDFRPFIRGHDETYNLWIREHRDVWSPWLRRFLFERGIALTYLGSLDLVHNHQERGSNRKGASPFFIRTVDWRHIELDLIDTCVVREPPVYECFLKASKHFCTRLDGNRSSLVDRGWIEFLTDKLWICSPSAPSVKAK